MFEARITNAPHVPRKESFLDSGDMVANPVSVFERYRFEFGPTFTFHFGGVRRTIVSSDPEFIGHVLKDNHSNYQKSDIQVKRMAEFQGTGLLNSHGEFWLKQRRLLSHGFSRSHLTELLPLQAQVLAEFMSGFEVETASGPIDIYQHMVKLTLRLVGKSLFGNQMKEEDLEQIQDTISKVQAFMVRQIVEPYKIPWFRIIGETRRFQQLRRESDEIVRAYVDRRRRQSGRNNDLLDLILHTPYSTGEVMDSEQAMIEILQLLVAGNETSSNTLSWTFYLLAKHPEYISEIRDEVRRVFGNRQPDFKALHKLTVTLQVLDEAMRIFPPFWMIDRVALRDDEACSIKIPAGVTVVPYIYGTHHNSSVWKDPDIFDPTRFDPTRKENHGRHSFAHIPFGGGPRICIGQNMAIMQMLLIVATVVRDYDFRLTRNQIIGMRPMMILRPEREIMMSFKPVR